MMSKVTYILALLIAWPALPSMNIGAQAQQTQPSVNSDEASAAEAHLTGVYRLDVEHSDKLYSVVAEASSNLPFAEQQRFFIDLTVRLTPPDQLAIERRGRTISIASSRAPRTTFEADGQERVERTGDSYTRIRAAIYGENLIISSLTDTGEGYRVSFTPLDNGQRLRVTRHISDKELNQPVVIQSIYNKISEVAEWGIYGEPQKETTSAQSAIASMVRDSASTRADREAAGDLRDALAEWIAATNRRDIGKQMGFYMPVMKAFYLKRNVAKEAVRREKARVFERAKRIDIRAEEPEIVFRESRQIAIMRFRKRYAIEGGGESRRGEVVQELRWQRTSRGWRIYSERDVRVIR